GLLRHFQKNKQPHYLNKSTGRRLWHIYLFTVLNASFGALQGPAFGAAVTQLVAKAHFGRANGLMQLGHGIGQILAPALAGLLIAGVGLWSVLPVDMTTFFAAVLTLLLVRFPAYRKEIKTAVDQVQETWRRRAVVGKHSDERLGRGKRKVMAVFGAYALVALGVFLAGLSPSVWLLTTAVFLAFFFLPTVMGGSQAIMQAKVAPEVQGRVFALNGMLNTLSFALAFLISGPLADRVFEPLLAADGLLANSIGQFIGVGPGRGMGFMFVATGLLAMGTAVSPPTLAHLPTRSIIMSPCLATCCKRNCMFLGNGRFSSPVSISSKSSTRGNYAHGNPYYKLLRTEVAALAQALHGAAGVKEQAAKHQLRKSNREINSLKRKLAALEKQKAALQK
ncbi:MAG: MFS transporter, partial [Chloroflexi bacterium]|nr:MFS transporter [Chloroflexota bacterium]